MRTGYQEGVPQGLRVRLQACLLPFTLSSCLLQSYDSLGLLAALLPAGEKYTPKCQQNKEDPREQASGEKFGCPKAWGLQGRMGLHSAQRLALREH